MLKSILLGALLPLLLCACTATTAAPLVPLTVEPPTSAPTELAATATAAPTSTAVPTLTAIPTRTPTLSPTDTPTRTATAAPTLTATTALSPAAVVTQTAVNAGSGGINPTRGQELFRFYTCDSCHDISQPSPGGFIAPNLGNIAVEAERIIRLAEYTGKATNANEYIHESVLTPNVYIVPGKNYTDEPGLSGMDQDFAKRIPPADLDDIAAYLLSLNNTGSGDPARGKLLFATYTCDSCHDVTKPAPGGEFGPNLGNIAAEAQRVIGLPAYRGKATNPADYIRESILAPNAYLVPGDNYLEEPGRSVMPSDFGGTMPPQDLTDLIAYLLSLN